jgi:hypothetical protein
VFDSPSDHGLISDISGKNPCHSFHPTSHLRPLITLLASGIHRVVLSTTPPQILTASNVLEHLVLKPPQFFSQTFLSPNLDIPLNPLISLYSQGSVLDAMQVMSLNNLSALGVLGESSIRHRRSSSSSSSSRHVRVGSSSSYKQPSRSGSQIFSSPLIGPITYSPGAELPSPFDSGGIGGGGGELMNIITAEGCGRLVVPSQGREALGMGLGEATKSLQVIECAGQERGEERVPGMSSSSLPSIPPSLHEIPPATQPELISVHTITCHSTILHASHLILATSSSRVFLRTPTIGQSPSISPTIPSPPSPSISISSLSLSDPCGTGKDKSGSGLPTPPQTVYSPHYVVSITDILGALGRAYLVGTETNTNVNPNSTEKWGVKPETEIKGQNQSQGQTVERNEVLGSRHPAGDGGGGGGLGSWKWAKEQGQEAEAGQAIA